MTKLVYDVIIGKKNERSARHEGIYGKLKRYQKPCSAFLLPVITELVFVMAQASCLRLFVFWKGKLTMATWITHLMIADGVLARFPKLDRRGFCVGNIAPDCNVENADWTAFTPSREVTHWMRGARKTASDCDAFCKEYIIDRWAKIESLEERAFLLGYYSHLISDAAFQAMIRNVDRVKAAWSRLKRDRNAECGMEENWDTFKMLVSKRDRMREIYAIEAKYLLEHPDSGYLTEILPLRSFPDYIDYLPKGAIVRKIGVMGYLPEADDGFTSYISISREEYATFVSDTIKKVSSQIAVFF